jgi:hypothetical protein
VVWLLTWRAPAWPGGSGCGGGVDLRLSGAPQVHAEVVLDPVGDGVTDRFGVGEEGLEVVLDDRVERGGRGLPAPIDGTRSRDATDGATRTPR